MESLYFLIPLSLVVLAVAVWLLFWAVGNGQYDDIDREGEQILFDDDFDPPRRAGNDKGGKTDD